MVAHCSNTYNVIFHSFDEQLTVVTLHSQLI